MLITAGRRGAGTESRLFEVRRSDGQVVWEMVLPENNGTYRAERLDPPPLVQRIVN